MVKSSHIKEGSEAFVFTDNEVMEQIYVKSLSKSPKLHDLIVELRKLEMEGRLIFCFVWIASTRMIAQGTDALSRGEVLTSSKAIKKFL